jgi:hypothetical protein
MLFRLFRRAPRSDVDQAVPPAPPAEAIEPADSKQRHSMPTVRFDPSRVTDSVKADLMQNIKLLKDVEKPYHQRIYDAALRSISAGRDVGGLTQAIRDMGITGMTNNRSAEISLLLNNKATAIIRAKKMTSAGIQHAIWLYSGAGCVRDPRNPSPEEQAREAAHIAADGQRYEVAKGMFLNGRWTHPGWEEGCKCVCKAVVPGLDRA